MTGHGDVEDLQTTKSEKLLAVVMTAFLLLGGIWTYQKLDDWIKDDPLYVVGPGGTPEQRAVVERYEVAARRLERDRRAQARARGELELNREAYRTALEEGRRAPELAARYRAAERAYVRAADAVQRAEARVSETEPAANEARREIERSLGQRLDRQERNTFLARLGLTLAAIAAGFGLVSLLRNRNSRYLPLAGSVLAFATILALVLASDYLTDYFDPFDLGLLLLSLVGVALSLAAFWGVQRYIRRRLPQRRVRRGECPFCGWPVRGDRCESCGRAVVAPCSSCAEPRRVDTPSCSSCGATAS